MKTPEEILFEFSYDETCVMCEEVLELSENKGFATSVLKKFYRRLGDEGFVGHEITRVAHDTIAHWAMKLMVESNQFNKLRGGRNENL